MRICALARHETQLAVGSAAQYLVTRTLALADKFFPELLGAWPGCHSCPSQRHPLYELCIRSNAFSLMTDSALFTDDSRIFQRSPRQRPFQTLSGNHSNGTVVYAHFRDRGDDRLHQRNEGKRPTGCVAEHGPGVSMGSIGTTSAASRHPQYHAKLGLQTSQSRSLR
jgi:hypothetical protein